MHKQLSVSFYALALLMPAGALANTNLDPFLVEAAHSDARMALRSTHAMVCSDLRNNLESLTTEPGGAGRLRFGVDGIEYGTHRNADQGLLAGAGR